MVYTVTFSPALDYVMRVRQFREGAVNRAVHEHVVPGGKGINVSVVLGNLGVPTRALGFVAGFTGDEIERRLVERGIETDFVRVPGMSRINVKLKSERETDVNGRGPAIAAADVGALFDKLEEIPEGSTLVLAGTVPESLPQGMYERILERLEGRKLRTAVDATGELLRRVLPYRPFLVKPNHHELGELFGRELRTEAEIAECALELRHQGAQNVLVSRAGEGALLAGEDGKIISLPAPRGTLVDSVGAGDSVVAGFLAGVLRGYPIREAFRLGVAAGSATAFSEWLASREAIEQVQKNW